mmetsp:Transcript_28493/g.63825  ORF Transcript_28493/g.63825 Transcript_28493/m.63825 type:complete len:386 (+) Transcript_28493:188-1345(+)
MCGPMVDRATSSGSGSSYLIRVVASTLAYWFFVSLIPIYNKHYFQKEFFPKPVATAGIQLGLVSVALTIISTLRHSLRGSNSDSWVLGPHFLWKVKAVLPIGFLFGLKYGITNLGLKLVPAPIHLLLQSTDLIWTLLWAWLINGETVSRTGLFCLLGCILGTAILALEVWTNVSAPVMAIVVNLVSPILLGLCIATLRSACVVLMRKDNRVKGTVTSIELTALKLAISSTVALILASAFEDNWLQLFRSLPASTKLGIIGSSLPILAFQVNCTYLTGITSAVSVGLVGQLKIIPQWLTALFFSAGNEHFVFGILNVSGSMITVISAAVYALDSWRRFLQSNDANPNPNDAMNENILKDETARLLEDDCGRPSSIRAASYHAIDVL